MSPDLVVTNADIRTQDIALPRAQALAIAGGRIVALGTTTDMLDLAAPGTRRIDAGGRLCLPGFLDAHVHLADGGHGLIAAVDLGAVRTVPELQAALAAHAARWPGPVVAGYGWQPGLFGDENLTREVIEAVVADRPVLLHDSSYHNACANTAALRLAGFDDGTAEPPNGHLVRDRTGRLTGMLHEDAALIAAQRMPQPDEAELVDGARAGMTHANRHGITGIVDPKVTNEISAVWRTLALEDALTLRVSGAAYVPPAERPEDTARRLRAMRADSHGAYLLNAAKLFLDGVFENRTAACLAPYADPPGGNAPLMFDQGDLARHAALLGAERFQLHFHCIGDAATRAALNCIEAGRAANGPWPQLPQIAHCQLLDPADLPRFAALGAMANVQPLWARYDPVIPDIALDIIGAKRLHMTYAFRQLLDAGAPFCLSSDFPVSTLNPFEIIETAVTRQAPADDTPREPFLAAEALTVAECVAGYTLHAARALWREEAGRLAPGQSADLILLDRDIFAVPASEISGTQVELTLFKGAEVHRAAGFGG